MKYNLPPFNEVVKRGFFEQHILDFSSELFKNQLFGIAISVIFSVIFNIVFLFSCFKFKSCLSIIVYIFLVYLIFAIILFQISKFKRNK